jgi:tetratricopeptide (TPR) repeat protein
MGLSAFIGSFDVRLGYWKSVPSMVKDYFLLGSGPGTFGTIYSKYRLLLGRETQMAHNNYLQVLVETGVVGLLAFLWIWIRFLKRGYKLIITEREDKMLILGCFSGITGFLIHSFVDFGFYVPGITMTVFLFLGLMETREKLPPFRFSVRKGMKVFLTIVILTVTACMIWAVTRPMLGERCFGRSLRSAKNGETDKSISLLKKAIEYCPRNAKYHFQLGLLYEGKKGRIWLDKAIESQEFAVEYNPCMAAYHSKLSLLYWFKGRGQNKKLMEKAILEMQNAVSCYPVLPKYHMQLGRLYHLAEMYEKAREEYILTFKCKDAIYRGSEGAKLQEMLKQVEGWLSELKNADAR